MKRPSNHELLAVWDEGVRQHPVDRALTLLAPFEGRSRRDLAESTIGQRDDLLLRARALLLGPEMPSYTECPECGEQLEFVLRSEAFLGGGGDAQPTRGRLPNSYDLAAIAGCGDVETARTMLLDRCGIDPFDAEALTSLTDEQSAKLLDLNCPACSGTWESTFDIVSFFWEELAVFAKRLLGEVDLLARAYGWTEADILQLNARRREYYVEMAGG